MGRAACQTALTSDKPRELLRRAIDDERSLTQPRQAPRPTGEMTDTPEIRNLAANTIRALAIDAVNAANSGHPGAPMGLADIATVLWADILRYDPAAPDWADRDRFVLSNGHGSMLLYAMLHLSGYDLSIDDLKNFRKLKSKTPGHPEYGITAGVETTTGPLGQGFANAVGLAVAERMAKARFNGQGFDPITHRIYGILGDGCMMEGVTSEAASLAGHLGLGELIFIYDDNQISIDGSTEITFTEDVEKRFEAYGWHTLRVDGHDQPALKATIETAQGVTDRPTLILAKTHIGFGSPNRQDKAKAHGEPLGADEGQLTKENLGYTHAPFEVDESVRAFFGAAAKRGAQAHAAWKTSVAAWRTANADAATAWDAHFGGEKIANLDEEIVDALADAKGATRKMSGAAINAIAAHVPGLIGGSADLAGSNKSTINGAGFLSGEDASGRNIHFGIREHAMASMVNGMALYGGFVPFGATFLTFSDYMRPALRLSALMKIRALQVFTHDSIGLGEDGPTHQAVEQIWALRLIPGLYVWRPADGVETAMAWTYAVQGGEPAPHSLVFTRQSVAQLERGADFSASDVHRGGYVLADRPNATVAIMATGSEVGLAVDAAAKLAERGINARVVSMPCLDLFLEQDDGYREQVLPRDMKKASVEAGRSGPWAMVTGIDGLNLGVDAFGESAPHEDVYEHFGLTPEAVADRIATWAS
nr:transketolase 2-like [Nerophis lumbriciformis]